MSLSNTTLLMVYIYIIYYININYMFRLLAMAIFRLRLKKVWLDIEPPISIETIIHIVSEQWIHYNYRNYIFLYNIAHYIFIS